MTVEHVYVAIDDWGYDGEHVIGAATTLEAAQMMAEGALEHSMLSTDSVGCWGPHQDPFIDEGDAAWSAPGDYGGLQLLVRRVPLLLP